MSETPSENKVLDRIEQGLKDAVEAKNLNWVKGTRVKRQKYTDQALDHYLKSAKKESAKSGANSSPITRSWFKYGRTQPFGPSGPSHLGPDYPDGPSGPSISDFEDSIAGTTSESEANRSDIFNLNRVEFMNFFLDVAESPPLNSYHWGQSNLDFLENYYEEKAPRSLRDAYLANIRLRKVLQDAYEITNEIVKNRTAILTGESDQEKVWNNRDFEQEAGRIAVDLRLALRGIEAVPSEVVNKVTMFTDLLEDVLMVISTQNATDISTRHYRILNELDEFYDGQTWEYVALYFSIETAIGPNAETIQEAGKARIESLQDNFESDVEELRDEVERTNLEPELQMYSMTEDAEPALDRMMAVIDSPGLEDENISATEDGTKEGNDE